MIIADPDLVVVKQIARVEGASNALIAASNNGESYAISYNDVQDPVVGETIATFDRLGNELNRQSPPFTEGGFTHLSPTGASGYIAIADGFSDFSQKQKVQSITLISASGNLTNSHWFTPDIIQETEATLTGNVMIHAGSIPSNGPETHWIVRVDNFDAANLFTGYRYAAYEKTAQDETFGVYGAAIIGDTLAFGLIRRANNTTFVEVVLVKGETFTRIPVAQQVDGAGPGVGFRDMVAMNDQFVVAWTNGGTFIQGLSLDGVFTSTPHVVPYSILSFVAKDNTLIGATAMGGSVTLYYFSLYGEVLAEQVLIQNTSLVATPPRITKLSSNQFGLLWSEYEDSKKPDYLKRILFAAFVNLPE